MVRLGRNFRNIVWAGFCIAIFGTIVVIIQIRHSRKTVVQNYQNPFLSKHCLDEKGQVTTDENGLIQYKCIDQKAQIARGGDDRAIRELTDTIFGFSSASGLSENVLEQFKDRLVRSESRYRAGSRGGIPEENILRAINNLASKLHAPDYATSYSGEVKLLRDDSRSEMPHFISAEGQPMSPLESTYVLDRLVYQKVFNETFLLTPAERSLTERAKPQPETRADPSLPPKITVALRVKEMRKFVQGIGTMKLDHLIELAHELLDDLGIDR